MKQVAGSQRSQGMPRLWSAVSVGLVWLSLLMWMALQFANPILLNREQVLHSSGVVKGRFPTQENRFEITSSSPDEPASKTVQFENFSELTFSPNQEYLVPVVVDGDRWEVTPSPLKGIPLIYPATEAAEAQLAEIIKSGTATSTPQGLPD